MGLDSAPAAIGCRPHTASFFDLKQCVVTKSVTVDLRHYGWTEDCDRDWPLGSETYFQPSVDFIDYSLRSRPINTLMLVPQNRDFATPGNIVFIPAGRQIPTQIRGPSEYWSLCVTFGDNQVSRLSGSRMSMSGLNACIDVRNARCDAELRRLAQELRQPGFASDVLIDAITNSITVELYRHLDGGDAGDREHAAGLAAWRLKRVKDHVHGGLSSSLSLMKIADDCGLSPRHLIRTFKSSLGMTLSEYVSQCRVARAKTLLDEQDMLIKTIAYDCGFNSTASFCKAFRKATGQTPKQYRHELRRLVSSG